MLSPLQALDFRIYCRVLEMLIESSSPSWQAGKGCLFNISTMPLGNVWHTDAQVHQFLGTALLQFNDDGEDELLRW